MIGSGGISHWVGTAEMGRVNEAFDREILDYAVRGDTAALAALRDDYIGPRRQWRHGDPQLGLCHGRAGRRARRVIAYEAVPSGSPAWVSSNCTCSGAAAMRAGRVTG